MFEKVLKKEKEAVVPPEQAKDKDFPDADAIRKTETMPVLRDAWECSVINAETCEGAARFLQVVKMKAKMIGEKFSVSVKRAYEAHKAIKALESECLNPLDEAEKIVKSKMVKYYVGLHCEAAKQRADMTEEISRSIADLDRMADEAMQKGNADRAAEFDETKNALILSVDIPDIEVPKGISVLDAWDVEVKDRAAIPDCYMVPDLAAIRKVVAATKGRTDIPGILVKKSKTIRVR